MRWVRATALTLDFSIGTCRVGIWSRAWRLEILPAVFPPRGREGLKRFETVCIGIGFSPALTSRNANAEKDAAHIAPCNFPDYQSKLLWLPSRNSNLPYDDTWGGDEKTQLPGLPHQRRQRLSAGTGVRG